MSERAHLPSELHEGQVELHIKTTSGGKQSSAVKDMHRVSHSCPSVCVLHQLIIQHLQGTKYIFEPQKPIVRSAENGSSKIFQEMPYQSVL